MLDAIFFDFDGVVIDSEPIHAKTKALALDAYQIPYPAEIFERYKGVPENDFFIYVSKHLDPLHRPYQLLLKKRHEYLMELIPEMPIIQGFFDFLNYVKNKGIKTALVTSSTKKELSNIDKSLSLTSNFDKVISAEKTIEHKPHPAPYLKALDMMKAKNENSLVIEDSPNGIISGKKAGCRVYALTSSFTSAELTVAGADRVFSSFYDLKRSISSSETGF